MREIVIAGDVAPLVARVNHGRWIVDCPNCRSASFATAPTPRLRSAVPSFVCPDCNGGPWPAGYPAERAAIVALLDVRPDPTKRNWAPGETLGDLAAENAEHGL